MARITITNPKPFKRIFTNPLDGRSGRICRKCGAHIYGPKRCICSKCLKEGGTGHGK